MFKRSDSLEKLDPAIWKQIVNENKRQEEHIELIASENYTLPAVMEAQGSQLTNKYAEGYIGKRFYGGCEYIDEVERIAIDRLKELYGAEYANVQPHSGSQANQAVYFSMLKPGDTIMGMNLGHGGHLTHGSPANLSGKLFNIVPYGLNEQEVIDYDEMERLAIESKPKLIIGGASAYSLKFDWERMSQIAKKVGALFMVDVAHYSGLVAGGAYPNPMPFCRFCYFDYT
jgi:glycine hydroxymethyltransferase